MYSFLESADHMTEFSSQVGRYFLSILYLIGIGDMDVPGRAHGPCAEGPRLERDSRS